MQSEEKNSMGLNFVDELFNLKEPETGKFYLLCRKNFKSTANLLSLYDIPLSTIYTIPFSRNIILNYFFCDEYVYFNNYLIILINLIIKIFVLISIYCT